ncbi:putative twinfilin [Paratrimastix pyriformis]|uniref:Twinfilin n=1 Tax=Paratrimastix pyriformis TaxID=342808 RepID=A0ABQ8UPP7_9EUKA|nr:putative twinfilin [Paratrimastix pyriformis]
MSLVTIAPECASVLEDSSKRWIKFVLEGETLVPRESADSTENVESDWSSMAPHFADREACYVLFRMSADERVLVRFVSERAPVRVKTLMSAATERVKRELNATQEFHGVSAEDMKYAAYVASQTKEATPAAQVLTESELNARKEARMEVIATPAGSPHMAVALEAPVREAVAQFGRAEANFVELLVTEQNAIQAAGARTVAAEEWARTVTAASPAFYLLRYCQPASGKAHTRPPATTRPDHRPYLHPHPLSTPPSPASGWDTRCALTTHPTPGKGRGPDRLETHLFVYVCPSGSTVRLRMLHSMAKNALADALREALPAEAQIAKTLEIRSGPEELTVEAIEDALGVTPAPSPSPSTSTGPALARTARPGRGPVRLVGAGSSPKPTLGAPAAAARPMPRPVFKVAGASPAASPAPAASTSPAPQQDA